MLTRTLTHTILGGAVMVALAACGRGETPAPAPAAPAAPTVEAPAPEPPPAPVVFAVAKEWDLTAGEDVLDEWRAVADSATPEADGVHFVASLLSGPIIASRRVDLPAADYAGVRVRASLQDGPLQRVRFFWSRSGDIRAAEGGWAYSDDRVVTLTQPDPADPTLWEGRLDLHPRWGSRIEGFFVEARLPNACADSLEDCVVVISEISLLSIE